MHAAGDLCKRRSQAFFDARAAAYDHRSSMGIRPPLLAGIFETLSRVPQPDSILDVGCGTGELLVQLKSRFGAVAMAGLDLSANMLAIARQKLGAAADLRQGDSEALPWDPERFSLVCCTLCFHHFPHAERALAEMRRVLKPGGQLLLADVTLPTPFRQLTNLLLPLLATGDHRAYSRAEVLGLLDRAGFRNLGAQSIGMTTFLASAFVP